MVRALVCRNEGLWAVGKDIWEALEPLPSFTAKPHAGLILVGD